jgi:hypothetical protein
MRLRSVWLFPALFAGVAWSCVVGSIDLAGKACPCGDGWTCDTSVNRCVPGNRAGSDASVGGTGAKGGSGGTIAGGTGGTSTGGTTSTGATGGTTNTGGTAPTGGGTAGTGGTVATGGTTATGGAAGSGGLSSCSAPQKVCNGVCVNLDDPAYGCAPTTCDPCPTGPHMANTCANVWGYYYCLPTCDPGYGNCDGLTTNGCEVQSSPSTCGLCSDECSLQGGSTKFTCFSGNCGCSTTTDCKYDTANQVACNTTSHLCVCGSATCKTGEVCVKSGGSANCSCNGLAACAAGSTCCYSGCANLQTDTLHCGNCYTTCLTGQTCSGGQCI